MSGDDTGRKNIPITNFRRQYKETREPTHDARRSSTNRQTDGEAAAISQFLISVSCASLKLIPEQVNKQVGSSTLGKETHGSLIRGAESRGKHSEFAQVSPRSSSSSSSNLSLSPSLPTYARGDVRIPSPFLFLSLSPFSSNSLLSFRLLSLLGIPRLRSLHFLCLFRVFATECHNFREKPSIWTQVGGDGRIRIKRTDCRKLVESPDEISPLSSFPLFSFSIRSSSCVQGRIAFFLSLFSRVILSISFF